jgi:hypothetical protein
MFPISLVGPYWDKITIILGREQEGTRFHITPIVGMVIEDLDFGHVTYDL